MGLVRGMARTAVIAGTATATSNAVNRRQAEKNMKAMNDAQQNVVAQQPQVAAPAPAPVDDTSAELQKLKNLLDQGLITVDDYEAKKKQLLGI